MIDQCAHAAQCTLFQNTHSNSVHMHSAPAHYFRTNTQIKHTSNSLQIFTENVRKLQFLPPFPLYMGKKTASLGFFNYECSHFCFIVSFILAQ